MKDFTVERLGMEVICNCLVRNVLLFDVGCFFNSMCIFIECFASLYFSSVICKYVPYINYRFCVIGNHFFVNDVLCGNKGYDDAHRCVFGVK